MLLGLAGRKGSGKDTVADELVARHGFVRFAFADPVKWVARDLWPHLTLDQCWGPIEVKEAVDTVLGASPRWILQRIGTEVGRNGDLAAFSAYGVSEARMREALERHGVVPGPTAWIDALFRAPRSSHIVIPDVRFPNEAEAVRSRHGWVLKILRPDFDTGVGNDHPSEREVDACAFDYLVRNDRGVGDLHGKIRRILADLTEPRV